MDVVFELIQHLLNPEWIINHGGLFLVAFIIFAETGLFIGFFLPGDSLLFVTGMVVAVSKDHLFPFDAHVPNLIFWILFLTLCAVLGNFVGYWFGKKFEKWLYSRKDSLLFKRRHLDTAHEFYDKKGGFAVFLARFLPIVRTFVPIIGGVVGMDFKKFAFYNVAGAIVWVIGITMIGYALGENDWVKEHLGIIIILLVAVTTLPVIFKMLLSKKKAVNE